jgi:hypothetical protein
MAYEPFVLRAEITGHDEDVGNSCPPPNFLAICVLPVPVPCSFFALAVDLVLPETNRSVACASVSLDFSQEAVTRP